MHNCPDSTKAKFVEGLQQHIKRKQTQEGIGSGLKSGLKAAGSAVGRAAKANLGHVSNAIKSAPKVAGKIADAGNKVLGKLGVDKADEMINRG